MRYVLFFLLFIVLSSTAKAQSSPFQIIIEPISISGLPGVQAFAFGQHNEKWLVLGGRTDGLHRRQPFAAFDVAGQNDQLTVVDPLTHQIWSASLTSLPVSVQEQFRSTNMEFHQEGDFLYVMGGYGFSNTAADHITYPYLTAVNVPEVIDAIITGSPMASHFRQITDEQFAVTGGYLNKIYDTYYITGGQRFTGRYNPMNNPCLTQEYTNSIRRFVLSDDGTTMTAGFLPALTDAVNLHRRDYNVIPQIMPDGEEGLTAFSGVFQSGVDLPYLNCVNIDSSSYVVNNDFAQYYNHYHCAHIPVYSADANEMHNLFFGGIAQYYDSAGILIQNNEVPFVKTIARVSRSSDGTMAEYKLPIAMPALQGAGSEFIPLAGIPHYPNEVIKLDEISDDTTMIGYLYGGIQSSAPNIFFTNTGTQSNASPLVFKVFLLKNTQAAVDELNQQSTGTLHLQVYPNPNAGELFMKFHLKKPSDVTISLIGMNGELLQKFTRKDLAAGDNILSQTIDFLSGGGVVFLSFETTYERVIQKIYIEH